MKIGLAGALLVVGAVPARAQDSATVAAEIRLARTAQNAALAARAIDSAATFWADDVVVTTSLGRLIEGKVSYRSAFNGDTSMLYQRVPERVDLARPWAIAWEEGTWTGQQGRDGPVLIRGRYAAQWHQIGQRWLIRSELFVGLGCSGGACSWPTVPPRP